MPGHLGESARIRRGHEWLWKSSPFLPRLRTCVSGGITRGASAFGLPNLLEVASWRVSLLIVESIGGWSSELDRLHCNIGVPAC
jgi:hypothetical protein